LDPKDGVVRYRYGRALEAGKDEAAALSAFEETIRIAENCPAPIAASAYLDAARLHERLAHTQQAIEYYRAASAWFGGAADARARSPPTRAGSPSRAQVARRPTSTRPSRLVTHVELIASQCPMRVPPRAYALERYSCSQLGPKLVFRMRFFDFRATLCLTVRS